MGTTGVLYALGKPLLSRGTALEDELAVCFLSETWFSYQLTGVDSTCLKCLRCKYNNKSCQMSKHQVSWTNL